LETTWNGVTSFLQTTCGTRANTLYCWGENGSGQLGLNDTTQRNSPVQVPGTTWQFVAAGNYHVCATRTDRTLWCWGGNGSGQLGLGDITDRDQPAQVGSLTSWYRPVLGVNASCAVSDNRTTWCWGANFDGQLGLGDYTDRTTPVQMPGGEYATVAPAFGGVHLIRG
jgi:alpha-tubulin suppressor-like RCC1 family protein